MTTTTQKTAIFMMGGPGSGKSFIAAQVSEERGIKVIDCDSWKEKHPNYDAKNPSAVHAWSKLQVEAEMSQLLADGTAFIYDGTGANAEQLIRYIRAAQVAGFTTEAIYVTCNIKTALRRNSERTRQVEVEMLLEKHSTVGISFEIIGNYADKIQQINND